MTLAASLLAAPGRQCPWPRYSPAGRFSRGDRPIHDRCGLTPPCVAPGTAQQHAASSGASAGAVHAAGRREEPCARGAARLRRTRHLSKRAHTELFFTFVRWLRAVCLAPLPAAAAGGTQGLAPSAVRGRTSARYAAATCTPTTRRAPTCLLRAFARASFRGDSMTKREATMASCVCRSGIGRAAG